MATWGFAVIRLTGLLAAVGLVTSRAGLLAHELVGHGGAALLAGGKILEVRLFYVAGGWIRYRLAEPTVAGYAFVEVAGIAVEAVLGLALLLLLIRRDGLAARIARGVGAALVVHAGWYFATGTWHGYGDFVRIHRELGAARVPIALAVGLASCAVAFLGARIVLGSIAAAVPGARGRRIAGVATACLLAGGLQIALALGEVRVRRDDTYGTIMQPERERVIARELAAWQRQQPHVDEAARAARARELAAQHRVLPFAPILAVLLAAAVLLGARRARPAPAGPIATRFVALAAALAGGSIALVIALDAAFH
ncbi:MAG: hypothetical protein WKG01_37160 [Kofleriaceae bacterium]